jgi:hypothetical protein
VQCFGPSDIAIDARLNDCLELLQSLCLDAIAWDVLVVATVVATKFEDLPAKVVKGWVDPSFEGCELDFVLASPHIFVPLD